MRTSRKVGLIASLLLVSAVMLANWQRNAIVDWYKLRGYEPTPEIVQLADSITLEEDSRRLFYVNRPIIAEPEVFNANCRDNEYTIVLGCYLSGQNGIFLLNVTDERLNGIKEVTAAHELLHAVYERLSSSERDRIDTLLTQTFVNISASRIKETIELYRKQDPSVVPNELHSILGTEVRQLPKELEEHYSRYFKDRLRIVGFSEQYEQAFLERKNAARDYAEQLSRLKSDIESLKSQLEATEIELTTQKKQMDDLRASGRTEEYNALVPSYNAKANKYNSDYDKLSQMIVEYNSIVQKHNSIVAEEAELIDAIDSREVSPKQ